MKNLANICLLFLLCTLTACESSEEKAKRLVETFIETVKDSSNTNTDWSKLYPDFKKMEGGRRALARAEWNIDECSDKKNVITVTGTKSFYDDGIFRQDKVSFNVAKNKQGDYVIVSSKNLIYLPPDIRQFAELTGAITDKTTDAILSSRIVQIILMNKVYIGTYKERLNNSIEIKNFSWYYDWGTPKGEVTIENTLPFDVYNVKYHIEYTYGGSIVGTDEGLAVSSLKSGERTTFTFYSYKMQGKNARRAQVTFSLPETLAKEWMMNDTYTGKEYDRIFEPKIDSIGVDKKVKTYF